MNRAGLYFCEDRTCGAEDCSTCFPGNEHERETQNAREEYEISRWEQEREL